MMLNILKAVCLLAYYMLVAVLVIFIGDTNTALTVGLLGGIVGYLLLDALWPETKE